jgi:hypothetical protein
LTVISSIRCPRKAPHGAVKTTCISQLCSFQGPGERFSAGTPRPGLSKLSSALIGRRTPADGRFPARVAKPGRRTRKASRHAPEANFLMEAP